MASVFETDYASGGFPTVVALFGSSVVYKQVDADDTTLTAVLGPVTAEEMDDENGRRTAYRRDLKLWTDTDQAVGGVADPAIDDVVTIDGDDWTVTEVKTRGDWAALKIEAQGSRDTSPASLRFGGES